MYDVAHAADFRITVDVLDGSLVLAEAILKCLDGDLQPDLAGKLEAIRNRLCGPVNAPRHSLNRMLFDPFAELRFREADHPK